MNELFADIDIYLTVERKFNTMVEDRFLHDYSAPFKQMGDDWKAPDWYVQKTMLLEKKSQKTSISAVGCTFIVDDQGNLTIQSQSGNVQIAAEDRMTFMSALFSLPTRGAFPLGPGTFPTSPSAGGQTSAPVSNNIQNDDRPQRQEQMKQSLREMEKWAQGSSKGYSQHK